MEKLKEMALKIVFACIFQWRDEEIHDDRMRTTLRLIAYFKKLPRNLRDLIFTKFNWTTFWDSDDHRVRPEARHVALFLYEQQQQLLMDFPDENFDFEFLLQVGGHKLKNLTELKLPKRSSLTASVCQQMCHLMPNLQKLDLSRCYVEDNAVMYIANLPLVEFDYWEELLEHSMRQLCREDSKARNTLRVLKSEFRISDFSPDCYCLILKTMRLIEDMGSSYSTWLKELSPIELRQQYNIRKLCFNYTVDAIEEELDISVVTCPKVTNIEIVSNIFTRQILRTLTKFKELNTLNVRVCSISDVNDLEEENGACDRVCLDNLRFDNLVDFTLCDINDGWISSGYFFTILDMCPNLEKLQLLRCDGFSNRMASELAKKMANKKLKYLTIDNSELLGPSGIDDLLKIASLVELKLNSFVSEITKQHFDAHPMQQTAAKHGVNLQLNIPVWDRHFI